MATVVDYYAVLGISPAATDEDVRQAYRIAARRFHPDVNKSPGAALIFRDINTAYEVLSDRARRLDYDAHFAELLAAGSHLELQTFFSRSHIRPLKEPQLLYVLMRVVPNIERKVTVEAPLNLCLVIDRSKSMAGVRMQHVKSASHRIIDACKPNDLLSIVAFSDDAEVVIPAQHPEDQRGLKAMVSTIRADGATAMLAGLRMGLSQIERNRDTQYVNHMVLITDGRTYGDEEDCLTLARKARANGVGISGMGIGEDWNDRFLDALANQTGGSSAYVASAETVTHFLQNKIRALASACAERAEMMVAAGVGADIREITRISPSAITLPVDQQPIPVGVIDGQAPTSVMLQFHLNAEQTENGDMYVGRVDFSADLLGVDNPSERVVRDLWIKVGHEGVTEEPPPDLLDALSKLMLYRLQDRAREAIEGGDIPQATRSLEYLATRLFEAGEEDLGNAALHEARRISQTQVLSEEGAKRLKYGTRALMPDSGDKGNG